MLKKFVIILLFTTGGFITCPAQQASVPDTTSFKLKEVYVGMSPLYVMDGKIVDQNTIQAIDPETIKKIDVLNVATATERFGEMGKNGAVVITLKEREK